MWLDKQLTEETRAVKLTRLITWSVSLLDNWQLKTTIPVFNRQLTHKELSPPLAAFLSRLPPGIYF